MTIKNFNVGPSELFGETQVFINEVLKNGVVTIPHRSPKFSEIYKHTEQSFKKFFKIPDDYKVFFTYSATDAMDIVINGVAWEQSTHVDNGIFWKLFIAASNYSSVETEILQSKDQFRVSPDDIVTQNSTLVVTANDTSTWMEYSNSDLLQIRSQNMGATFIVDATSSFWAIDYDISLADAWVLSVQKNLWLPSWLGVLIVNEKILDIAKQKQSKGKYIGWHNSLMKLNDFYKSYHTPATPNTTLILGLWYISEEYRTVFENISNLDKITKQKADYVYSMIKEIDGIDVYNMWEWKSNTTLVLSVREDKLKELTTRFEKQQYSVSPWLFDLAWKVIRIANFPTHTMEDMEKLIELMK